MMEWFFGKKLTPEGTFSASLPCNDADWILAKTVWRRSNSQFQTTLISELLTLFCIANLVFLGFC